MGMGESDRLMPSGENRLRVQLNFSAVSLSIRSFLEIFKVLTRTVSGGNSLLARQRARVFLSRKHSAISRPAIRGESEVRDEAWRAGFDQKRE